MSASLRPRTADLATALREGRFRSDLYYRLHVFPIVLPPLRERPEDIPLLARHFIEHFRTKLKKPPLALGHESMTRLCRYAWPGNVRELQNVIERAVILTRSSTVEIDPDFLAPPATSGEAGPPVNLVDMERGHILAVLQRTHWRIYGPHGAAAQLGLNPSTLRSRLKKLGLSRPTRQFIS